MPHRPLLLAALLVAALGAPAARAQDTWSTPHPGLSLLRRVTATPNRIFALRVDLCARGVSVRVTAEAESPRTTGSFRSLVGAQGAINGGFYNTSTYEPLGLVIGNGTAWHADDATIGYVAFGPDRSVLSTPTDVLASPEAWMREAVGGFPILVRDGVALTTFSPAPSHCPDRHPRTAVGFSRDRQTLWLVVVDGRSAISLGMTCGELAALLQELGAWEALNLDGGGSSTLVVDGLGTINVPSDGSERSVANHLAVFAGGAGAPGSCDLWMDEVIIDAGVLDDGGTTDVNGDGRADLCARAANGFRCYPSTGSGFGAAWSLAELADAEGWSDEANFATIRMGDVNGDGFADLCARADAGVRCWPSTGSGWGTRFDGPALADADGWDQPQYFSTLRLLDFTGDGLDDLCARGPAGVRCWPSTGGGFGAEVTGPEWSDALGWDQPYYYGTLRTGDVDGDGRFDLCARGSAGVYCALSDGAGFPTRFLGPDWSNARGYADVKYWSTLRLADLDFDARDDLCIRGPEGVECRLSTGGGFGPAVAGPSLTDASGWGDLDNASTLRLTDVDGDHDRDLCGRASAGIWCWLREAAGFGARLDGPAWNDAAGWDDFRHYATLRFGDLDGDGRDDVCGRAPDGVHCWLADGAGFPTEVATTLLADAGGWWAYPYFSTLRFAGPRRARCLPAAEVCNGRDDDCDHEIDEGCFAETDADADDGGDAAGEVVEDVAGPDAELDTLAETVADVPGADADAPACDPMLCLAACRGEGRPGGECRAGACVCDDGVIPDAGTPDDGGGPGEGGDSGGCGCAVPGRSPAAGLLLGLLALGIAVVRRR